MCILRTIAPTKRLNETDNLTSFLKSGFNKRDVNVLRKERIRSNENVATWYEDAESASAPIPEVFRELPLFFLAENGESGQRLANASTDCGWDPPDAAVPVPKFCLLFRGVLFQAIGGVCDNSMNAIRFTTLHPLKTIPLNKFVLSFTRLVGFPGFSNNCRDSSVILSIVF